MLPTPGIKSTKLDITMKMKNVVANGKTQPATRLSRMSPIKPSHPSMSASITFCPPDGISLMRFHVVRRTMTTMSAATIQVQIIELVTGKPRKVKIAGGAAGTSSSAGSAVCAVAMAELVAAPADGLPATDGDDGCAFTLTANIAARNAQTNIIVPNRFTQKHPSSPHELPKRSTRIMGLKGRTDCLAVEKFTSTFWTFLA